MVDRVFGAAARTSASICERVIKVSMPAAAAFAACSPFMAVTSVNCILPLLARMSATVQLRCAG